MKPFLITSHIVTSLQFTSTSLAVPSAIIMLSRKPYQEHKANDRSDSNNKDEHSTDKLPEPLRNTFSPRSYTLASFEISGCQCGSGHDGVVDDCAASYCRRTEQAVLPDQVLCWLFERWRWDAGG